jgi:mono/diheme cytochrome c family protein
MRRLPLALALVALPLAGIAGCGGEQTVSAKPETVQGTLAQQTLPKGDAGKGKQLFASSGCGGCHTLKAAGTNGTAGPDLDQAKPSYDRAFTQIKNGGGGMPPFGPQLGDQGVANVATFVVQSTGGSTGG